MKTLLTFIVCLFFTIFCTAQINSKNVLEYHERNLIAQSNSGQSQDILLQIGNGNRMEVIDKTPYYIEISQLGDYNITSFVNPNNYPTNVEINVQGSRNYIDIVGSNSISDGMKININANDMTLHMRNY